MGIKRGTGMAERNGDKTRNGTGIKRGMEDKINAEHSKLLRHSF